MSEIRRGAVLLIQAGDEEIAGAIAEGILAAREGKATQADRPERRNWGEVAHLVKVAVGNTRTAEDYMILRAAAEQDYGTNEPGPLGRVLEKALAIYAMFVEAVAAAYRAQDRVLGGR